jgi:acyl-CoA dehydrogenase
VTGLLSSSDLPMFMTDGHRRLGDELATKITGADDALQHPASVGARLAELGLFELLLPSVDGGRRVDESSAVHAVDVRALCLVREALAYHSPLADSVFAVQGLGSYALVLTPDFPGRADVLRHVRRGEDIGGFALTEPDAGSDVASMQTTARRDGADWVLDGEKTFISNVGIAHHFLVFAKVAFADVPGGPADAVKRTISAFFVRATASGLTQEAIATSGDHPLGRLVMRGCRVPEAALIGEVGHGLRLALGTLDIFRTSVGAAAVGMARRALDDTRARVKARVQFGKRLADQQLTQAALADMATELDAARLLVFRAAWLKDHGQKAASEVAMAKLYATEAAQRIIDRAVQLHGGLGVTSGTFVERLYREVRPLRIYEGTSEIQRLIIGAALVTDPTHHRKP